jgi:hypothetical protein
VGIWVTVSWAATSDHNTSICIRRIGLSGIKYHILGNSARLITLVNLNANYRIVVLGFSMIVV